MIELSIRLNLPIHGVVVTGQDGTPPSRLTEAFSRIVNTWQYSGRYGSPSEIEALTKALKAERIQLAQSIAELQQIAQSNNNRVEVALEELREAAIELAVAVASKLVFEQVDTGTYPIANLVHEVLGQLNHHEPAVVRLHPDDLSILQEQPTISGSGNERDLQFVPDANLSRGDCKAKCGEISVVYELRQHIEEIRRQLLSAVTGHVEPGH